MSIEDSSVVDGMGTEVATGTTVLTISDHLDWTDEKRHLQAIQEKLNAYLDFVDSGQLFERRPEARETSIRIDIIAQHAAPETVGWFFERAEQAAASNNVGLVYKQLPTGY